MSLTDLEKRAVLASAEKELDRQKEKAAKFKKQMLSLQKRLKDLCDVATDLVDTYQYDHLAGDRHAAMEELKCSILLAKEELEATFSKTKEGQR